MTYRSSFSTLTGRRGRWRAGVAAVVALSLVAAACGGDDDGAAEDEPATEATDSEATEQPATDDAGSDPETADSGSGASDDGGSTGSEGTEGEPADDGPAREQGGHALMVQFGSVNTFDPAHMRVGFAFAEAAIMAAIYGHLAYMNPQTGEVIPYFLESIEPNDDFTVWTLTLHDGIKFSDGTPLDAEAIRYNIARSADPDTGSRFYAQASELGLNVVDPLTIEITLPEPNPGWAAELVANYSGIGSPTAIQAALDAGEDPGQTPVGAGPFMLEDWEPGQTIELVRNPYFSEWKPGLPYLDSLTFENVPDRTQQAASVTTGTAQIAGTIGGAATQQMVDGANAIVTQTGGGAVLNMNTAVAPFDDIRARLFMMYAFDRDILAEANAPGTPKVTNIFPETSPFYDARFDLPDPDPERAQALLDELAAEGKPLKFTMLSVAQPDQNALYNAMLAQLAAYDNVEMDIEVVTFTEQIARSTSGEYQLLPWGMYVIAPVPGLYYQVRPDGFLNYGKYSNDVINAALEDFKTADTVEKQKAIWDVVQEQMLLDPPVVLLDQGINTVGFADGFYVGRTVNLGTLPLWDEVGYIAE